ncbi:MAG: type III-B CRISPR module RAMP protein Cmr4 [Chlorobium sp.]|nr:type III-B CRISPR module RAMP protein Cmr4 [Chlorobium sp.]
MYLQQNSEICVLHAISPIHAGAGSATGAVDLPIQRERHTGWPHIQASGVKGAFRDHCERVWMLKDLEIDKLVTGEKKARALDLAKRVFGRSDADKSQAGAIAFSDAKLLAFPTRSNLAPFVWVVCPALLKRLARDLALTEATPNGLGQITIKADCYGLIKGEFTSDLILEDICLTAQTGEWPEIVAVFGKLAPEVERLVLIPDDHFSFLMETATEVQAQIKIDSASGTTQDGSLRYQELLPADSVLYTVVFFGEERAEDSNAIVLETLRTAVQDAAATHIQIGGDLTLGRGIFHLEWKKGGSL